MASKSTATRITPRIVLGTMTFGGQTNAKDALTMVRKFVSSQKGGTAEIDTARMYVAGETEKILGSIYDTESRDESIRFASKANPWYGNLSRSGVRAQLEESLRALRCDEIDLFYLHGPDQGNDIHETLAEVQTLFEEKKFRRFALSNFTAWETTYIHMYMKNKGWIVPSIYQGMYNAITRSVEDELLPALRRLGMAFYAYNPLAGGMLTGKHKRDTLEETRKGGRFTSDTKWGQIYQQRFMQDAHFDGMKHVRKACEEAKILPVDAALRWMVHHSSLSGSKGDAIIFGASKMSYFDSNLKALIEGAELPEAVLSAYDVAWGLVRDNHCVPSYSRGHSGSSL